MDPVHLFTIQYVSAEQATRLYPAPLTGGSRDSINQRVNRISTFIPIFVIQSAHVVKLRNILGQGFQEQK